MITITHFFYEQKLSFPWQICISYPVASQKKVVKLTLLILLFREALGLTTFTSYPDLVGNTHSQDSVYSLETVYPHPGDMEIFPAGIYLE